MAEASAGSGNAPGGGTPPASGGGAPSEKPSTGSEPSGGDQQAPANDGGEGSAPKESGDKQPQTESDAGNRGADQSAPGEQNDATGTNGQTDRAQDGTNKQGEDNNAPSQNGTGDKQEVAHPHDERLRAGGVSRPDTDTGAVRDAAQEIRAADRDAAQTADETERAAAELSDNVRDETGRQLTAQATAHGEDTRQLGNDMKHTADGLDNIAGAIDDADQKITEIYDSGRTQHDNAEVLAGSPAERQVAQENVIAKGIEAGRRVIDKAQNEVGALVDDLSRKVGAVREVGEQVVGDTARDLWKGAQDLVKTGNDVIEDSDKAIQDTVQKAGEGAQQLAQDGVSKATGKDAEALIALEQAGYDIKGPDFDVESEENKDGKLNDLKMSGQLLSAERREQNVYGPLTVETAEKHVAGFELGVSPSITDDGAVLKGEGWAGWRSSRETTGTIGPLRFGNKAEVTLGPQGQAEMTAGNNGLDASISGVLGAKYAQRDYVNIAGIEVGLTREAWAGPSFEKPLFEKGTTGDTASTCRYRIVTSVAISAWT